MTAGASLVNEKEIREELKIINKGAKNEMKMGKRSEASAHSKEHG